MKQLIQIETSTACNAKCLMCPRDQQTRPHGVMDESLFWKIVEEAKELGIRKLLPFIDGEPFADPRMPRFIGRLSSDFPEIDVCIYTNGSLLDDDKIASMLESRNLTQLNVSIQGGDKETYERVTGLNWDVTTRNVERLIEANNRMESPKTIRMNMCIFSETKDSEAEFRRRWDRENVIICTGAFSNFGGIASGDESEHVWIDKPRRACDRAIEHVYVFWNGDVGQCCFDLKQTVTYGNLQDSSLREIIRSDKYQSMMESHRQIDVSGMPEICHKCNSNKFNG